MTRARMISEDLGRDVELGKLVSFYGSGLGFFYVLLIAQCDDHGIIENVTPEQLKINVVPTADNITPKDIALWLTALHNHDFLYWDQENELIYYDPKKFYRYQDYIDESVQRDKEHHPVRTSSLPIPRNGTNAEVWQLIDEVWQLVPVASQKSWTRKQIRMAIEAYPSIPPHEVKLALLSVLEKFDGTRTDVGFLFGNALRWKYESEERNELEGVITASEYSKSYRSMVTESRQHTADVKRELEKMMEEVVDGNSDR